MKAITRKLNAQLSSVIQEYAIVTPKHEYVEHQNQLELSLRRDLNDFLMDDENSEASHGHRSNFMRFSPHHRFIWADAGEEEGEVLHLAQ